MKRTLTKAVATLALGFCLTTTSCIGPNNAYNSLAGWNSKVSEEKWLNELLFLGLHIVPAYPLFLFGDYLIFNSWEFWTGKNLIDKPEPFKPQNTKAAS